MKNNEQVILSYALYSRSVVYQQLWDACHRALLPNLHLYYLHLLVSIVAPFVYRLWLQNSRTGEVRRSFDPKQSGTKIANLSYYKYIIVTSLHRYVKT